LWGKTKQKKSNPPHEGFLLNLTMDFAPYAPVPFSDFTLCNCYTQWLRIKTARERAFATRLPDWLWSFYI
jgi:hypothetical protein